MTKRDFLAITALEIGDLERLVSRALFLKQEGTPALSALLSGKVLALLFEKPSLRTKVSFDVAMYRLGGHTVYLSQQEVGLGERELVADVARALSTYVDIVAVRSGRQEQIEELARYASVPVINALSEREHPCQAVADLLTIREAKGRLRDVRVAYVGDANNVGTSLLLAGALCGMDFRMASPAGYGPAPAVLERAQRWCGQTGGRVRVVEDPAEAADGADVLYTDVWVSMGQELETEVRRLAFAGYQVNAALVARAAPDVIVMHDLPAHRGEEISAEIMDAPQSVIFPQAANRLPAHQSILLEMLRGPDFLQNEFSAK